MSEKEPTVIRDGRLKISIWRNEGENGPYYISTPARTFKDGNGDLRDAQNFRQNDLLVQSELFKAAYHCVNELRREDRRNKTQDQSQDDDRRAVFKENRTLQSKAQEPRR